VSKILRADSLLSAKRSIKMAIRKDIKNSKFFSELSLEQHKKFDTKRDKFLPNIDTLYYSVFLEYDLNGNSCLNVLLDRLKSLKEICNENKEQMIEYNDTLFLTTRRFAIYEFCLSIPDLFDIYIANYLPSPDTPRIVCQIRSYGLWLENGNDEMINKSFNAIKNVFDEFEVNIVKVSENRIDYCYHTNYIQEAYTFFNDVKLEYVLDTTLDIWQKIGHINKNYIDADIKKKSKFSLDYFALGQRKSNSLFIRHYNKTREVIEEGYKVFFFALWLKNGLISEYDLYCYNYAFKNSNFKSLDVARLLYYLDFGSDLNIKFDIQNLLTDPKTQYKHIIIFADSLMPKVTLITNIEFQTKRKFYYNAKMLKNLPVKLIHDNSVLVPLYQILDNKKIVLEYITRVCLSYGKHEVINNKGDKIFKYASWWTRLRGTKLDSIDCNIKFARTFMYEMDKAKLVRKFVKNVSILGVYNGNVTSNFVADLSDALCVMNDNDRGNLNIIDSDTGEVLNDIVHDSLNDYVCRKEKKFKTVKNRLSL
jgi:hypothetical protein